MILQNCLIAGIRIQELALPIKKKVQGVCNLLGFDPLNISNEGKVLIVCSESDSSHALKVIKSKMLGKEAAIIGKVVSEHQGMVVLETKMGGERIIEVPSVEELPHIC